MTFYYRLQYSDYTLDDITDEVMYIITYANNYFIEN